MKYKVGQRVRWEPKDSENKPDQPPAEGEIVERYIQEITVDVDGGTILCEATTENPGYLIERTDGKNVMKYQTDLNPAD